MVGVASAIENCFWAQDLEFVHDREDFSGNYTVVKEYQLKQGTVCEFLINTKTKITWQSEDLSVRYLPYFQNPLEPTECKADTNGDVKIPYVEDTEITMGYVQDRSSDR